MKTFKVDLKNNQKFKQLGWFFDNYSEVYNQDTINLYFCQISTSKDLFFKNKRITTYVFQTFMDSLTVENIRDLEGFTYIVSLFTGRFSSNSNTVFMSNLSKIKEKSKVICLINLRGYLTLDQLFKDIQRYKEAGFRNISFINQDSLYLKNKKVIEEFLNSISVNLISLYTEYTYIVDESGNILNPKNKLIVSNIYKYPAYLLFQK